jgi:hypothetical protein
MKHARFARWVLLFFFVVFITACGGDTSKQNVSGVAATGAPIKGTVVLKDSNGTQLGPVNTDDNGYFSFDVTNLTPPYILQAIGVSGSQNYTMYSVTTGPGDTHITPFSSLALQLTLGADPATIFGEYGVKPNISSIDDANLKNALNKIENLFAPILTEYGITNFDPIHGAYVATPANRLDSMLDVIGIKVENGNLTITNKLNNNSVIVFGSLASV